MIIYKDILQDDEIISDVYDFVEPKDGFGCLWEINGQMITPGKDEIRLEGANASAEGEDAEDDEAGGANSQVLDLANSFRLQKIDPPSEKSFSSELKKYLKNVMTKMKEIGKTEEEINEFKGGASKAMKKLTTNFKNYDFYLGESAEATGDGTSMVVLVDFREDGMTPYATVWKHGLHGMKV